MLCGNGSLLELYLFLCLFSLFISLFGLFWITENDPLTIRKLRTIILLSAPIIAIFYILLIIYYKWFLSRRERNRLKHALNGNPRTGVSTEISTAIDDFLDSLEYTRTPYPYKKTFHARTRHRFQKRFTRILYLIDGTDEGVADLLEDFLNQSNVFDTWY